LLADVCVCWRLKKFDTDATVTCQRKRIRDRAEAWARLVCLLVGGLKKIKMQMDEIKYELNSKILTKFTQLKSTLQNSM
jgi:hypothetical protein